MSVRPYELPKEYLQYLLKSDCLPLVMAIEHPKGYLVQLR